MVNEDSSVIVILILLVFGLFVIYLMVNQPVNAPADPVIYISRPFRRGPRYNRRRFYW